ncbi:peptidase M61 [Oceanicaulis sp. LC35]|uniref:peptidase M61 n=1 Tax=Oceanicaulis sp. LC35 TaxID=3349635 RepID=UPI003F857211
MGILSHTRLGALSLAAASLALIAGCADAPQDGAQAAADTSPGPDFPDMSVTLTPGGLSGDAYVDVVVEIEGHDFTAGEPFLTSPAIFAGVMGAPYGEGEVAPVEASDANGPITLTRADNPADPNNFIYFRRWLPERDTSGPVTVHYRAPIELVPPTLGAGPPFDLRLNESVVTGAGVTFLVTPDIQQPFDITIDWDLSAMPENSIGVTSFGRNLTELQGPPGMLSTAYYMAGPVGRYPTDGEDHAFSAYWIGEPPFDPEETMPWSEEVYDAQLDFFRIENPEPYTFMSRPNPYAGGGGAGLTNSFMLSYPQDTADLEDIAITIIHEMSHKWIGGVAGPPGATSWFSEGMNVFYTRRVPLKYGLLSPEAFIEDVNSHARRYYTNAINDLPNDQIPYLFWRDTRVRTLPYDRGSLYFAGEDARIREASHGERTMDDIFFQIDAIRKAGDPFTPEVWEDLIAAELGEEARGRFQAMMAGEIQIPPSDAFGPCFTREETPSRVFQLGFDASTLSSGERIVTGLVEGSTAEAAGLRDGDRILEPVALERVQSDPSLTLTLQVGRGDDRFTVEYLPRGDEATVYTWSRVEDVDDDQCPL